ncbi:hypothetical protein Btru_014005 [Bulinus truncatus]|nr:hypothetical protein Btru_014005 [Bulinus truncatus]
MVKCIGAPTKGLQIFPNNTSLCMVYSYSYFGPNLEFKCNCEANDCNNNGLCNTRCIKPFFGYLCQYVDRGINAFQKGIPELAFLVDHDDKTCNDNEVLEPKLTFEMEITFVFLRIVYKDLPFTLTHKKYNIIISFTTDYDVVDCEEQQIREVNKNTADFFCAKKYDFKSISIRGPGVEYVCSMYISGGRNLAIKRPVNSQPESISKVYAVDGLDSKKCFKTALTHVTPSMLYPSWSITVPRNIFIQSIHIYNAKESEKGHLANFTLKFFDDRNREARKSIDISGPYRPVFDVHLQPKDVMFKISIIRLIAYSKMSKKAVNGLPLTFCQFQVLGDCIDSYTNLDCEREVRQCSNNTMSVDGTCYVTTLDAHNVLRPPCQGCPTTCTEAGLCPVNCTAGYKGEKCNEACINCHDEDPVCDRLTGECRSCYHGYFGAFCDASCEHCGNTQTCDRSNGHCHWGCVPGFMGDRCDEDCTNCAGDGSCLRQTGYCVHGCKDGYRGGVCILICHNCAGRGTCERIEGRCDDGCVHGYQGIDCSMQCGFCEKGTTCNRFDGSCVAGCQHGYKGIRCDTSCLNCVNESCNQEDGKCTAGCKDGFAGSDCETRCAHCNENDRSCDQKTRFCFEGCKPGYFEDDCSNVCETCGGDRSCSRKTGECLQGCKPGFVGIFCKDHIEDEYSDINERVFYSIFSTIVAGMVFYIVCYPQLSKTRKRKHTKAAELESHMISSIEQGSLDQSDEGIDDRTDHGVDPPEAFQAHRAIVT